MIFIPDPETCRGAFIQLAFIGTSQAHFCIQTATNTAGVNYFRAFDWRVSYVGGTGANVGGVTGQQLRLTAAASAYSSEKDLNVAVARKHVLLVSVNGIWLAFGESDWASNILKCTTPS